MSRVELTHTNGIDRRLVFTTPELLNIYFGVKEKMEAILLDQNVHKDRQALRRKGWRGLAQKYDIFEQILPNRSADI